MPDIGDILKNLDEETSDRILRSAVDSLDYPNRANGFFIDKSPQFYELAKYIRERKYLIADDAANYLWIDQYYRPASKLHIQNMISELTLHRCKPHQLDQFYKVATIESYRPIQDLKSPEGKINLKNGVLNLKTRKLEDHNPKYFFKYKIAHPYVKGAQCNEFKKFLNFVFEGDKDLVRLTAQIFGYTLLGGDPWAHKAFLLYGDGRNGKSTWLYVLNELLGKSNVASVSMKLLGRPFSMVSLDGKLANITEESPAEIDQEEFKNIVGGGSVVAAHKGKPEFNLKVDARLFFATNKLPRFNDTSTGNRERLCIIPFNRYIRPEERDVGIFGRLFRELSGVLNFALDGLDDLLSTKRFVRVKAVEDMLEQYMSETDNVFNWLDEYIEVDTGSRSRVSTSVLFKLYKDDAPNLGHYPVSVQEFGRRLSGWMRHRYGTEELEPYKYRSHKARGIYGAIVRHPNYKNMIQSNRAPHH